MKKLKHIILSILLIQSLIIAQKNIANKNEVAPIVFINISNDINTLNYIKKEISFVNYSTGQYDANIYIMVKKENTGNGGKKINFTFIGQKENKGTVFSLSCNINYTDTKDDERKEMVRVLKIGIIRFINDTALNELIDIKFKGKPKTNEKRQEHDPWNSWIISLGFNGGLREESSRSNNRYSINASANRITEKLKFILWSKYSKHTQKFEVNNKKYKYVNSGKDITIQTVFSLNSKWSAGFSSSVYHYTYINEDLSIRLSPTIEYNFFPYSESMDHQFRFMYRVDLLSKKYIEMTIMEKEKEFLFGSSLFAILEIIKPWGNIGAEIKFSHFFHDFGKNRLSFSVETELKLIKGLSLSVFSKYEKIQDQINIAARGVSKEEILLQQKQISTGYNYNLNFGFRYRFGSKINNVVNPRFGN